MSAGRKPCRLNRRGVVRAAAGRHARRVSRRGMVRGAAVAALAGLAGCAQVTLPTMPPRQRPAVVAVLSADTLPPGALPALLQGLAAQGWALGHNLVLAERAADGEGERLPGLAAELLALPPDALVTVGAPATRAARAAATTVPIVFLGGRAPAAAEGGAGTRPARGNVTGVATGSGAVSARRLALLGALVPGLARAAVFGCGPVVGEVTPPEPPAGLALHAVALPRPEALGRALDAALAWGAQALVVTPPFLPTPAAAEIAAGAAARRLPTLAGARAYPRLGGLAAYAPRTDDLFHRAAALVDRILKGTPPAALPVEPPGALDLILNLGAARALGLSVPPDLLREAAEVLP